MAMAVERLSHQQLPLVLRTLARAFAPDPMGAFLFPNARTRERQLERMFKVEIRYALQEGLVETLDNGAAVAIWMPPERTHKALGALLRSGVLSAPFIFGVHSLWRICLFLRKMQQVHMEIAPYEHWYLLGLAVHPELQGQGKGAVLLQHGLNRAKAERLPCYLETTNPANLQFYSRCGFKLAGTRPSGHGNPELWAMVYQPELG
jgi:ribosomal protein S18 acetylase RimI-like enzyme